MTASFRRLPYFCAGAAALLVVGLSNAQAQDAGKSATSLPGDQGPTQMKPGQVFVPFPGGGPPPWERGPLETGPGSEEALRAAHAAITACATNKFKIAVAVVDSVGQPRATLAADGVRGWHIYSATRKALTALALEEPSSQAMKEVAGNTEAAKRIGPAMTTMPGAVPILRGGKVIGAVGVSGARSGEADELCAAAGAAKLSTLHR
jgi:uncharacterized protein GlcG (DUF336 family)